MNWEELFYAVIATEGNGSLMNDHLDERTATEVIGWHKSTGLRPDHWIDKDKLVVMPVNSWNPTKDADDAFRVVDKMGKLGFRMELHIYGNESHCQFIPFDSEKEFSNFSSSSSDSKPLTDVCLAALEAVEPHYDVENYLSEDG